MSSPRLVYVVTSSRALGYFEPCLGSLLAHALEPLRLRLLTDTNDDVARLGEALGRIEAASRHDVAVVDPAEVEARAADRLATFSAVARFRGGHPCWRKVTDPQLLAEPGEEIVLLDHDVYFPNHFTFEPTPAAGILLMKQRANCLYHPEVVRRAMQAGIPLADHTDIGVSHVRAPFDLAWLEWLLGRLDAGGLPPSMHVESIVWAALAMHAGGGHLDPATWVCWHKSLAKRVRRLAGRSGVDVLRGESLGRAKCFHAGGVAKWWLADAEAAGVFAGGGTLDRPTPILPFEPYGRGPFERKQAIRTLARVAGFYRVFGEN